MSNIHATAIVDPAAQIGENVTVGAYAVIGKHVTLADNVQIGTHAIIGTPADIADPTNIKIGTNTIIGNRAEIKGITTIGADCRIESGAVLGGKPQDKSYNNEPTELIIGDRNTIGELVTIHRGTAKDGGKTIVGNDCYIMGGCHIAHDCMIGNNVTMANNTLLAGHVKVDDFVTFGGSTGVHQKVHIGKHAMIGGFSAVDRDILPYCLAEGGRTENEGAKHRGINVVGLKRRGLTNEQIHVLQSAFDTLFAPSSSFDRQKNLTSEKHPDNLHVKDMLDFIDTSNRGIAAAIVSRGKFSGLNGAD